MFLRTACILAALSAASAFRGARVAHSAPRALVKGRDARVRQLSLRAAADEGGESPKAATEAAEEQEVKDLNLEEMFEVFEAADQSIADGDDESAPDQMDIIKRVKPRDDWWSNGPLASPLDGVSKSVEDDPLDKLIVNSPLPSGAFLALSTVLAIAFVGCIFQLFYDKPAAPVLGVPLTGAISVTSGPGFLLAFLAAIKKGNAETDDDWN